MIVINNSCLQFSLTWTASEVGIRDIYPSKDASESTFFFLFYERVHERIQEKKRNHNREYILADLLLDSIIDQVGFDSKIMRVGGSVVRSKTQSLWRQTSVSDRCRSQEKKHSEPEYIHSRQNVCLCSQYYLS